LTIGLVDDDTNDKPFPVTAVVFFQYPFFILFADYEEHLLIQIICLVLPYLVTNFPQPFGCCQLVYDVGFFDMSKFFAISIGI
jgi:hypothetical protein